MSSSRRLGIVVRASRGAVPVIVAVTIAPAACNSFDDPAPTGFTNSPPGFFPISDASVSVGGIGGSGAVTSTGGSFFVPTGGFGGTSSGDCYFVDVPPEGVPADPGQICAVTTEPVDSNTAARVQLFWSDNQFQVADGLVAVNAEIANRIVGLPTVEVVDATLPILYQTQIENMQKTNAGYSFVARWPSPIPTTPDLGHMTVRTTLILDCGADAGTDSGTDSGADAAIGRGVDGGTDGASRNPATRIVHAATNIHLCIGLDSVYWASSGDQCMVCNVVAEMAPSPIVPDKGSDGLPLARAVRLRIVVLARVSNSVVLLAENDGGPGLEYEWHPSAGALERIAPDVVVWSVEQGMQAPFIQAAVVGADAAAVATFAWNEVA